MNCIDRVCDSIKGSYPLLCGGSQYGLGDGARN